MTPCAALASLSAPPLALSAASRFSSFRLAASSASTCCAASALPSCARVHDRCSRSFRPSDQLLQLPPGRLQRLDLLRRLRPAVLRACACMLLLRSSRRTHSGFT